MTDVLLTVMIGIGALMVMSLATALTKRGLSMSAFLCSVSIGIGVMVWVSIFPPYFIILSVLIIVGMFFTDGGDGTDE